MIYDQLSVLVYSLAFGVGYRMSSTDFLLQNGSFSKLCSYREAKNFGFQVESWLKNPEIMRSGKRFAGLYTWRLIYI
jgi:hypothetical protein